MSAPDLSHLLDEEIAVRLETPAGLLRHDVELEAARRLRARDSARAPSTQAFRVDFEARAHAVVTEAHKVVRHYAGKAPMSVPDCVVTLQLALATFEQTPPAAGPDGAPDAAGRGKTCPHQPCVRGGGHSGMHERPDGYLWQVQIPREGKTP